MKKIISMIGLLCISIAILSGCSTEQNNFTEKNYTADSSQIQTINIDAIDRKIDIELSDDNQIYIDYYESEQEFFNIAVSDGGSTVALSGGGAEVASRVFVTGNRAAAVATVTVMCITWIRYKKPDVSMTLNGSLAGLVAITAGCDMVTPMGSAIIGIYLEFLVD